jgi:hypothetical protein
MTRDELEHIIRASADITDQYEPEPMSLTNRRNGRIWKTGTSSSVAARYSTAGWPFP